MSIESRWFGNFFGISGRQGMTWNDMQWESDWGRVYNGSEKRSALIGFDGFNLCIAHCHLWDLGVVYWMYGRYVLSFMNDSAHWRCPFYRWDSPGTKRFCEAWWKKNTIFVHKKALVHFHMVRDFWRRKFLQGRCSLWSSWTWHWSDTHLRAKFIGALLLPVTHVRDCRLLLGQQTSVLTDPACVDMM